MFEAVHRRLTLFLLCVLTTGVILIATASAFLLFSQKQLAEGAEADFNRSVNAILYHVRSQPVLDHAWLSQTEADGGLILHVELEGRALLYRGRVDPDHRADLVYRAKSEALAEGFDLRAPPFSSFQTQEVRFIFTDGAGDRYRAALATVPLSTGWAGVVVLRSMAPESAQFLRQLAVFGGLTLAGLVLLTSFAWFFTQRTLRPIEESRRKQNEFIAAASHELRSPLAVIHSSLSALGESPPEEQARRFIQLADGECLRLSRLVGDLLSLAGADSGAWTVRPSPTGLETVVLNVCEGLEARAAELGVQLLPILPEEPLPLCACDEERVAQVLSILVDNGLCYTPAGGRLRVTVERRGGRFRLAVADNGPGVPDGEKDRVFERFYRGDPSRTRREHYGLGLSVAKEIAALHGGNLTVEDTPGGGATFIFTLPA